MYRPRQLAINAKRMMDSLHKTCAWGASTRWGPGPNDTGMARLAFSDTDKQARDWFASEMSSLGCTVSVDEMGNMFAVRPGQNKGAPTAMGSHLDTQPTGGRYDGILGIHSAVESMRTVHEAGVQTKFPLAVVNWSNEEGARFPKSLHGSSVWSGQLPLAKAYAMEDVAAPGTTTLAELERIGYKGTMPASWEANPLAAHFEVHIEQGPILPGNNQRIGVVSGGQAYKWFRLKLTGRDSHAGTTPIAYRADPLLAASRIMIAIREIAEKHNGLGTVGILHLEPGSINTIPNNVSFTIDIRHPEDAGVAAMEADIRTAVSDICAAENEINACTPEWNTMFDAPAVKFHPDCQNAIRTAAEASVGAEKVRGMISGAGHDSCAASTRCPTGMIFVPCKDGLSHNPAEYTTPEDCALGAQVLLDAVMLYDQARTQ